MSKVSGGSPSVKSQPVYRVKNWSSYNRALVARGSLTVWIDDCLWKRWYDHRPSQRGAQFVYSDPTIEWMLTMRVLFGLPLRQTQGFIQSLLDLMGLALAVPDYSTLSRRQGQLAVGLPRRCSDQPMHLVVDSTGLKVYGEGEWKVRQHGWTKRRTWRKLHVGVNEATGEVVAQTLTSHRIDDASQVVDLLDQVDEAVGAVGGDGAYDKQKVFDALATPPSGPAIRPIIALRKDATIQQHGNGKAPPLARDEILRAIRQKGRKGWKQESGYHRRSLAETLIYRYKHLIGDQLRARSEANQQIESRLGCAILNRMIHLGKPQSYRVEKSS
ncbi:MAG: IS5 family transposase [bacterium]|nr:IS5 family transposase [bacterium]